MLALFQMAQGQTIGSGDVLFLGFKVTTSSNDGFITILPKVPIPSGTSMKITNKYYRSATGITSLRKSGASDASSQGTITLTFTESVSAGKAFIVSFSGSTVTTSLGSATLSGSFDFGNSSVNDQLFLYMGTDANPTFLSALWYPSQLNNFTDQNDNPTSTFIWSGSTQNSLHISSNGNSLKCACFYPFTSTVSGNTTTWTSLSTIDLSLNPSSLFYDLNAYWVKTTSNSFDPCSQSDVQTAVVDAIDAKTDFSLIYSYGKKRDNTNNTSSLAPTKWFIRSQGTWTEKAAGYSPWNHASHADSTVNASFYIYNELTLGTFDSVNPSAKEFKVGKLTLVDTTITTVSGFSAANLIISAGNILFPQTQLAVSPNNSTTVKFKFRSTTSSTGKQHYAQIAPTNAKLNGTYEYSLLINKPGWHHIQSPINTTWGNVTDNNPNWQLNYSSPVNIYWYDSEGYSQAGGVNFWTAAQSSDQAHTRPYILYFSPTASPAQWPTRLTFTGQLAYNDTDIESQDKPKHNGSPIATTPGYGAPWYTATRDGWNFYGNHTLSFIDVADLRTNYSTRMADLTMGLYYWDPYVTTSRTTTSDKIGNAQFSNYLYHNGTNGTADTTGRGHMSVSYISAGDEEARYIPPFGAFFMKKYTTTSNTSSQGYVYGRKGLKSGNLNTLKKKTDPEFLALELAEQGTFQHSLYLSPTEETKSYVVNPKYDIECADGIVNTISIHIDSSLFRIKTIPKEFSEFQYEVAFIGRMPLGEYSIGNHSLFANNVQSFLLDKKTNVVHDLSKGPYSFTNDTSFSPKRFVWIVKNKNNTIGYDELSNPSVGHLFRDGDVLYTSKEVVYRTYEISNVSGQLISEGSFDDHKLIHKSALENGMYIVKFDNGSSIKFIK